LDNRGRYLVCGCVDSSRCPVGMMPTPSSRTKLPNNMIICTMEEPENAERLKYCVTVDRYRTEDAQYRAFAKLVRKKRYGYQWPEAVKAKPTEDYRQCDVAHIRPYPDCFEDCEKDKCDGRRIGGKE